MPAFAVAATDWKSVAQACELVDTDQARASHIVETWHITRLPCLPRRLWISCRSTRSSAITTMGTYPWQRDDRWTECRGADHAAYELERLRLRARAESNRRRMAGKRLPSPGYNGGVMTMRSRLRTCRPPAREVDHGRA